MKFGRILQNRRRQDWRCISYSALKKQLSELDNTAESIEAFYQSLLLEISEVDLFFQKLQEDFEKNRDGGSNSITASALWSHAVLNYLAVLKISKKHSKRIQKVEHALGSREEPASGSDAPASPKHKLFQTSFFTAISGGSNLFLQAEARQLRTASMSCPVCFEDTSDPAVLPCSHRFCWPCLSNCAMQGISSCPLCRKEQSLEPVNLEIETILGCCAQHYYPTNQPEILRPATPGSDSTSSGYSEETSKDLKEMEMEKAAPVAPPSTPPSTPPMQHRRVEVPRAPKMARATPLLKALRAGNAQEVAKVLQEDQQAAHLPFLDHGVEPPLCCSVRLSCHERIVQLLLEEDVAVDAVDSRGRTALAILSSTPTRIQPVVTMSLGFCFADGVLHREKLQSLRVAELLLDARADPLSTNHGPSCLQLARDAGNTHLVKLFLGEDTFDEGADANDHRHVDLAGFPSNGWHTMMDFTFQFSETDLPPFTSEPPRVVVR